MSLSGKQVLLDIYVPNHSIGLRHDVEVILDAVKRLFADRVLVRLVTVPVDVYKSARPDITFPSGLGAPGDVALFIERAFIADFLYGYREKAILINPEWFSPNDKIACEALVNTVLHKSRHYSAALSPVFANHRHVYTGFTSLDPGVTVANHTVFSHFRGASTLRLTQELVEIWRQSPRLPLLRVQAYGHDIGVNTNAWVGAGNTQYFFGKFERSAYFQQLAQGGIHLCTTRIEGFGHFLNEARAMSALTIALDAPPMNELVTPETGILVPARVSHTQHLGTVYTAEMQDLAQAIERALSMPVAERERFGQAARALYERQAEEFRQAFGAYLNSIVDEILKGRSSLSPTELSAQSGASGNGGGNASVFDDIYRNNKWGRASDPSQGAYSGPGSHDEAIVKPYVDALERAFAAFGKKLSVVDIGCGDFAVGSRVRHLFGKYTACDVSQVVLEHCRQTYSDLDVDFRQLDAASDELPEGDVVVIRQVLQHLDNASIERIVRKIEGRYQYAVITEHLPPGHDFPANMDKRPGAAIRLDFGSGIVLSEAPFAMAFKQATELASVSQFGGRIVTTLYDLQGQPGQNLQEEQSCRVE